MWGCNPAILSVISWSKVCSYSCLFTYGYPCRLSHFHLFSGWCSLLFAAILSGLNQRNEEFLCIRVVSSCWYPKLISYYLSLLWQLRTHNSRIYLFTALCVRTFPPCFRDPLPTCADDCVRSSTALFSGIRHTHPLDCWSPHCIFTGIWHSCWALESVFSSLAPQPSPFYFRTKANVGLKRSLNLSWNPLSAAGDWSKPGTTHAKHVLYHWSLKAGF